MNAFESFMNAMYMVGKYSNIISARVTLAERDVKDLDKKFNTLKNNSKKSLDDLLHNKKGVKGAIFDTLKNIKPMADSVLETMDSAKVFTDYVKKNSDRNFKYTPMDISDIIKVKNNYNGKSKRSLHEAILEETGYSIMDPEIIIRDAMHLKVNNSLYKNIERINYDSKFVPKGMNEDIMNMYCTSKLSLNDVSRELEKKYGMYISASTLSFNARQMFSDKGISFKNRREARAYGSSQRYSKVA